MKKGDKAGAGLAVSRVLFVERRGHGPLFARARRLHKEIVPAWSSATIP
jgi:hypothetical protein